MRTKELLRLLKANGWHELPGKATSHIQLKHAEKPNKITVPSHPGDINPITLKTILKQAGIKESK